jgi:DNA-binding winged helix-turn-helix (wHTH) protein/Tfp pilus assembly protein PilF
MRTTVYLFGNFRLASAARELRRDGERLPLPRRAFDCLLYLIEHRSRAVGRDELTAAVWGRVDVTDAQLSQVMLHARRAIDDSGQAQHAIRTLPGYGYRWVMEIEEITDAAAPPAAPAEPPSPIAAETAQSAASEQALDAGALPAPEQEPRPVLAPPPAVSQRRRHMMLAALLLGALLAAAALVFIGRGRLAPDAALPVGEASAAVLVLPVDVSGPADSGWLRLGVMDLIAERLRNAGLPVPPSETALIALRGIGEKQADASARLRRLLGADMVVEGKASKSAEGWTIELLAIDQRSLRHTATSTHADVIVASRRAADLLLAALGRSAPAASGEEEDVDERLQQAHAALLAGETDTARRLIDAIPEPARQSPPVQLQLAQVDARTGRLDQAEAAYGRLLADPAVLADARLHGRVLSFRGAVRGRRTEFAAAEGDFDAAVAALKDSRAPLDLARALNGRAVSRIGLGRLDEAASDLGRARIELQQSGDRLGLAQSDTNFGLLEARRGRTEEALSYLLDAADRFESFNAIERMHGVLTSAFDAEAALLRWPEALAITDRQWPSRQRAGDPGLVLQVSINRSVALAALGRLREAQNLIDQAEREHRDTRVEARRYLLAEHAALAWRRGDAAAAAAAADVAAAIWPFEKADDDRRARLALQRVRAHVALGDTQAAELERELQPASDASLQPATALLVARAEWAAAQHRPDEAERLMRAALASAESRGIPAEVTLAAEAYGGWLLASGSRADEAGALAGRVARWADRDFDCALFQVAALQARGNREAWQAALVRARALAGEREIPARLQTPPSI